jgi:acetyl-CoA carboxylase biotin carboxyl carrier protein
MTIEEIKELIRLANETGVAELELQRGEDRVRIRRSPFEREYVQPISPTNPYAHAFGSQGYSVSQSPATPASPTAPSDPPAAQEEFFVIKSPIVGTYYDCPSPDSPPFVNVGDKLTAKTTVCIIESMKLMNEIEAEVAGTIVAKLVENGKPVEYGEALFTVRPTGSRTN